MTLNFACRLPQRGVVRMGGVDRRDFLQGLVSNDVSLCTPEASLYAAFLTPQGKFLHDFFLVDEGESFLVDCEGARADDLLNRLSNYKLRAKVTLENVSLDFDVWAVWGADMSQRKTGEMDPRLPALGARVIVATGAGLVGGYQKADFAAYDKHRIVLGVPDGSRDLVLESSTLLEGNMDFLHAISWKKGCYVGQELTARMHYRGLVKRRLYPVKIEGKPPAPFSMIEECGEMRSSCGDVGLALLHIEKAQASIRDNAPLVCGDARLMPYVLEWMGAEGT